jgi:hypothetical protein
MNLSGMSWTPDNGVGIDKNSSAEQQAVWADYVAVGTII